MRLENIIASLAFGAVALAAAPTYAQQPDEREIPEWVVGYRLDCNSDASMVVPNGNDPVGDAQRGVHTGPILEMDLDQSGFSPGWVDYTATLTTFTLSSDGQVRRIQDLQSDEVRELVERDIQNYIEDHGGLDVLDERQAAVLGHFLERIEDTQLVYDFAQSLNLVGESTYEFRIGADGYPQLLFDSRVADQRLIANNAIVNGELDEGNNDESNESFANPFHSGAFGLSWPIAYRSSVSSIERYTGLDDEGNQIITDPRFPIDVNLATSFPGQEICINIDYENDGNNGFPGLVVEPGTPIQTVIEYLRSQEQVTLAGNNWGFGTGMTLGMDSDIISIGPVLYTTIAGEQGNYAEITTGLRFGLPGDAQSYDIGLTPENELFEGTASRTSETLRATDVVAGVGYGHRVSDTLSLVPRIGAQLRLSQQREQRTSQLYDYNFDPETQEGSWVEVEGADTRNPVNHALQTSPGLYAGLAARIHGSENGAGMAVSLGVDYQWMSGSGHGAIFNVTFGGDGIRLRPITPAWELNYGPNVANQPQRDDRE